MIDSRARIAFFHGIMWSRYKGAIFSQVHALSANEGVQAEFVQIAETEHSRAALGGVDYSYHDYPYTLLFRGAAGDVPAWRKAVALIREVLRRHVDLVVIPGYDRPEYWVMLCTCIALRRRRAVFCDSTAADRPRKGAQELAKRIFFRSCDAVICYGLRSAEYVRGYGVPQSRLVSGVQAAALPRNYSSENARATRSIQFPENAPGRLLFVGRLSKEKGLDDLLHAFAGVKAIRPDVTLALIGSGPDQGELKELAESLRVSGQVEFAGPMTADQLAEAYPSFSALVLPSRSEPWGLVVNEALSYGLPVVVSDACGCIPELVVEGETGFVFPAGDVPRLVQALLAVLALANKPGTSLTCLERIGGYSPRAAALRLLRGVRGILAENAA